LRQQLFLFASLTFAASCEGSLWESPSWELLGTATAVAGYDSNLTFNRDGVGDTFGTALGGLKLERLNSLAQTEIDVTAGETAFLDDKAPSQFDASASLSIKYPIVDFELPQYSVTAGWSRLTSADPELNRRLTLETSKADIGGRVFTSGQFGLNADVDSYLYDYTSDGLGRNYQTELKLGPAYNPSPLTEISANFSGGLGASNGGVATVASVRDNSEAFTLQYRGEILPKLTSTIFAGISHVSYTGGFDKSSTLPTSGGQLVWAITPGKTLSGGVSLATGFAPDGEAQRTQSGTVAYEQTVAQSWSVGLRAEAKRYSDRSTGFARTDSSVSAAGVVRYQPSNRFDVSLAYSPMRQTSNLYQANFSRSLVSIQASYHL